MAKRKQLSDRQTAVLEDLFDSDLDEQGVLEKHRVRQSTYDKWLTEELFAKQFGRYVTRARRRSELLLAKYCCVAAAKLIELTASEKAETARKACLDIIRQPKISAETERGEKDGNEHAEQLPSATASKILAVLASETKV
jgi:ribosomal protein L16 Arg81 hydroxylase